MKLYVVRHGESILNRLDRVQGWADAPLTLSGVQDVTHLARGLRSRGIHVDAVYCADMLRHFQTAQVIIQELGADLTPIRLEGLREMCFGRYEGALNHQMYDDIARSCGYLSARELFADAESIGMALFDTITALNEGSGLVAEDTQSVGRRMVESLTAIALDGERSATGAAVVISSGLSINCALKALTPDLAEMGPIANASVTAIEYNRGTWTVLGRNDLSFVEAGQRTVIPSS